MRSEARYVVSFEPAITSGTGFVSSLSLIAKIGKVLSLKQPCPDQQLTQQSAASAVCLHACLGAAEPSMSEVTHP